MKAMYQVLISEGGRLPTILDFPNKKEAIKEAREWIEELKPTYYRSGAKKIGNLAKDGYIEFIHPAYGCGASVTVARINK